MPGLARIAAVLCALAPGLLAAPVAHAGTASVQGSTVSYTDDSGEARNVTWARDGSSIAIGEAIAGLGQKVVATAGPGCVVDQRGDSTATYVCSAAGVTDVRIDLGAGDDSGEATTVSAFSSPVRYFEDTNFPVTVLGGDGNDQITGGTAADTLDGGNGDDQLFGSRDARPSDTRDQPATDTMMGGPGKDIIGGGKAIDGGDGDDTIYGSAAGSTIDGGDGNDTITGGPGKDAIDGGGGDDSIASADGGDTAAGGDGNDAIETGDGNDVIDGGAGADTIDARAGADRLSGGDGPDKLDGGTGPDQYFGDDGDDTLTSDDGSSDVLDCGGGIDTVTGWDRGKDKASPRASCEKVPEGGLDQRHSTVLGYVKAGRTGRMRVRFRCVDCAALKVSLLGWQFWFVPNKRGLAIGSGCPPGMTVKLKRTTLDQFDGVIPLTRCQRFRLKQVLAQVRRGKARFRRFEFHFTTAGHTTGEAFTGGRR